jgi:sortase A
LKYVELFFWTVAALLLGCYALVYLDRNIYQAYESWSFDRKLEHKAAPVLGFVPHAFSVENQRQRSADAPDAFAAATPSPAPVHEPGPPPGVLIGRIEIPSVGIQAMVVNGTTDSYLSRAVGHIEGTALPGAPGNVGLAGHRDTFFRGLARIQKGDVILIRTLEGNHRYVVNSLSIVGPRDTEVLEASPARTLTLVTCYPFNYVGAAPRRFIVGARETTEPGLTTQPQGS